MDHSGRAIVDGQEVTSLPEAGRLAAAKEHGSFFFDLTLSPDINWPVHLLDVSGMRLATNGIASFLCLTADRIKFIGGGAETCWEQRSATFETDTAIYARAAEIMGKEWVVSLAEAAHDVLYERQQRLELLHCMALRLSEHDSTDALGKLIDRAIIDMAMTPLKATRRVLKRSAHVG